MAAAVLLTKNSDVSTENVNKLLQTKFFLDWLARLSVDFDVSRVNVIAISMFGPNVGFAYVRAHMTRRSDGKSFPGLCFLRAPTVGVLVHATVVETQDTYWLTVSQPKVGAASADYVEIPAGIIEQNDKKLCGRAAKELEEECGIVLHEGDLIRLGEIVPSAGGCSEKVTLFLAEVTLSKSKLAEILAKEHGAEGERESIRVKLYDTEDEYLMRAEITDAKFWGALAMCERVYDDKEEEEEEEEKEPTLSMPVATVL